MQIRLSFSRLCIGPYWMSNNVGAASFWKDRYALTPATYPSLLRMSRETCELNWVMPSAADSMDYINSFFVPALCGYSPCTGLGIAVRYWPESMSRISIRTMMRRRATSTSADRRCTVHLSYGRKMTVPSWCQPREANVCSAMHGYSF